MNVPVSPLLTTEQLLAFPDDGVERWLVKGHLRERPMTVRNRFHSSVMARVAQSLANWADQQPEPRGQVLCGEAGVRLSHDPDTTVGVDVVYVSAEVYVQQTAATTVVVGIPVLAVEILSPNTTHEELHDKLTLYLDAGVRVVWVIDPRDRTVRIYRPEQPPQFVNATQELVGDPELPGFRVAVSRLFA